MRSLVLLSLFCFAVRADTLVLRNGTRIDGRWWATDADTVHFLVNGHLEHYARPDLSEVIFGDAPAPPASAAPEPAPVRAVPDAAPEPVSSTPTQPTVPAVRFPDQIGVVYFQDPRGDLIALEQVVAVEHRTPASFPGRSPSRYWGLPGPQSPFRLRADVTLRFAIELPRGISPAQLKLYPLESKNGGRRTKAAAVTPAEIPVTMRSIARNVYIYVVGGLAPGEYAFSPANSNLSFCFGVDGPAAH
jgi:hypothetical protein